MKSECLQLLEYGRESKPGWFVFIANLAPLFLSSFPFVCFTIFVSLKNLFSTLTYSYIFILQRILKFYLPTVLGIIGSELINT